MRQGGLKSNMNKFDEKSKILQIAPLPQDTTVVVECGADEKDEYYPYFYDVREQGGTGFLALCEYMGERYVAVMATATWGGNEEAWVVPTVYCPACKTRMFARARCSYDIHASIMRDESQNGGVDYRCPTCGAEHRWRRPFPPTYDNKDVVDEEYSSLEETGWTVKPTKVWVNEE